MAATEPPAKKAKTEEATKAEEAPAAKVEVEEKVELETDAPADKNPKIKENVGFLVKDTTLNVVDSMFGNMLSCFSEGGAQYLLAGARASVGMKSGRYMFEVNVVELMNQKAETAGVNGRAPQPRNFFRFGLSTAGSSLLIGEDSESVCFDAEGSFIHNGKKTAVGAKFERSMNVSLVVNLDSKTPNANTVSVFRGGERICEPQALPESLQGKDLYPTITYRNITVHYNFGPSAHAPLPFNCRMLQDAAAKDVVVSQNDVPKDGKCTVVFPSCLPDEGAFQWLDSWLQENPGYTELSDRAILDWAQKSGIARLKPYTSMTCRDKPEMGFGLPSMDDKSVQKMIGATAALQKRNFVVMELQANILKEERAKLLASFGDFKKVALVVCGEPPKAFKKMTHDAILNEKQGASDASFNKKLADEKKKKALEKAKLVAAKAKAKAEKAAKKAAEERKNKLKALLQKKADDKKKAEEEAKKKAEEEKKAAEGGTEEAKEEAEMKEDAKMEEEEVKEEAKEEEAKEESEEEAEEPMEVEEADPEPPTVELTDEEKKLHIKPSTIPDVTPSTLNASFAKYSFPDKSEGFDEVKYEWQNASKSAEHILEWRQQKKVTARVEDLVVGDWFIAQQKKWTQFVQACKQKQNNYKAALAKKAADKATKENAKKMKAMQAKMKAEAAEKAAKLKAMREAAVKEAKAKLRAEKEAAGEEVPPEEEEEVKEEAKPMEVEEEKAEEEEEEVEEELVDLDTVDVFGCDDIYEIGGKPIQMPLFAEFAIEDWALMGLRFEMNLLVNAYKKDVKDPERLEIHEDNISYYYQKYFKKNLNAAFFGRKSINDLLRFLGDTLTINNKKILETFLPAEFETFNIFVLLAEESRRDRQRRMDLGEADAKISCQSQPMGAGNAAGMGMTAGQMSAINALKAQAAARPVGPGMAPATRPAMPWAQGARPAMPWAQPQQAWAQPQQAWGQPQQAWGPPQGAWGAGQGMRPGMMVRPQMMMPQKGGW